MSENITPEYYDLRFEKSGQANWTSANNCYVISRITGKVFVISDGHGKTLATKGSLAKAKRFASSHHVIKLGLEGYNTAG